MFFATLIVASLAYLVAAPTPVYAADVTWEGNSLVYEDQTYKELDVAATRGLGDIPDGAIIYQYAPSGSAKKNVKLIYFASGQTPASAKEATYIVYTLNPPNRYSEPRNEATITVDSASATEGNISPGETSCAVDNIGWIVCGISGFLADGVDMMYTVVASFLTVQPISDGNNSLYRMWDVMRNFANIMFTIGFLVVIYSYLVGGGFSGYEIRKIIPRIIMAAVLINVSYWICAVAVDVSNIIGASLQDLLINIRETAVGTDVNRNIGWGEITTYVLSGGTIGTIAFLAATGGSIVSFGYMLLGVLIVIAFALFVAFIILAARQALIIMLIILAPLAFAAYILPNTEKWFDRWRGVFTTMLVLFPIFSLLFGGAQLAGAAIIQNASNLAVMIFGMGVQVVPLVITPLLIQFSGSLIGRVAGIVNNSSKGIVDRSKGWTQNQADYHKDKALGRPTKPYNIARRGGQAMYRRSKNREDRRKNYQEEAENMRHAHKSYHPIDTARREAERTHKRLDAEHTAHWNQRNNPLDTAHFNSDSYRRELAARNADALQQQTSAAVDNSYLAAQTFQRIQAGDDAATIQAKNDHNEKLRTQGLTANFDDLMNNATVTAQGLALEGLKKTNAEIVLKGQMMGQLKGNETLRMEAGYIGEDAGANRVYARAKSEVVQAYLDDVKNSRSVLSEYSLKELMSIQQDGFDMRLKRDVKDNEALRDAAMQEIMLSKGNNWSFQKIKDSIAVQHGMIYDDSQNKYFQVQRDSEGNAILDDKYMPVKGAEIKDQKIIDRNRDVQQMLGDAIKNSGLAIKSISGTDRGNMEVGTFVLSGKNAILRDIKDKKIKATRLAGTDVDELQRMVQVLRDDEKRSGLTPDAREALADTIKFALEDPQVSAEIGTREKELLGVISDYAKDDRPVIPLNDKKAYEAKAATRAPYIYKPERLSDFGDGKGPDGTL